jgi:hypothetical protein
VARSGLYDDLYEQPAPAQAQAPKRSGLYDDLYEAPQPPAPSKKQGDGYGVQSEKHYKGRQDVAALEAELKKKHGRVDRWSDRNIAGTNTKSTHAIGNGLDVFDVKNSGSIIDRAMAEPGAKTIIYNRQIRTRNSRGEWGNWRPYKGVNPHKDHVHIDYGYDQKPATGAVQGAMVGVSGGQAKKQKNTRPNLFQVRVDQNAPTTDPNEMRRTGAYEFGSITSLPGSSVAERQQAAKKFVVETGIKDSKGFRDKVNKDTESLAAMIRPYTPDLVAEILAGAINSPANLMAEVQTVVSSDATKEQKAGAIANLLANAAGGAVAGPVFKAGGRLARATAYGAKGAAEAKKAGQPIFKTALKNATASDAIRTTIKSGIGDGTFTPVPVGAPPVKRKVKEAAKEQSVEAVEEVVQDKLDPKAKADATYTAPPVPEGYAGQSGGGRWRVKGYQVDDGRTFYEVEDALGVKPTQGGYTLDEARQTAAQQASTWGDQVRKPNRQPQLNNQRILVSENSALEAVPHQVGRFDEQEMIDEARKHAPYVYRTNVRPIGSTTVPGFDDAVKVYGKDGHNGLVAFDKPLSVDDANHYSMELLADPSTPSLSDLDWRPSMSGGGGAFAVKEGVYFRRLQSGRITNGGFLHQEGDQFYWLGADGAINHVDEIDAPRVLRDLSASPAPPPPKQPKAKPKAAPKPDPEQASVKNADTTADRELMGLEELPPAERKSWQTSLDNATANKQDTPRQARINAKRVLEEGGDLTDEQSAGIATQMARLKGQHKAALEKGDTVAIKDIEAEFDILSTATKQAGTTTARNLAARKLTINEDYDLISVRQRARVAAKDPKKNPEGNVSTKTDDAFVIHARDIKAAETRIKELEDALSAQDVDEALKTVTRKAKRKTTQQLDAERDAAVQRLKEALKQTTRKASSGIDPGDVVDISKAIKDLALNYVERGFSKLEDVISKVKEDFPALEERQIRDALSGYGKERPPRSVNEAVKRKNALVKEARLISQIEDALEGVYKPGKAPGKAAPHIQKLINELDSILKEQGIRKGDTNRLERLKEKLEKLQQGIRDGKKTKAPDPSDIQAIKKEIQELRTKFRYEDEIADLEEQLASGQLKVRESKVREVSKELDDLKFKRDTLKKDIDRRIQAQKPKTVGGVLTEAMGVPRSLMTATGPIDFSWTLRQALMLNVSHPFKGAVAVGRAAKAGFSKKAAYVMDQEMRNDPLFMKSQKAKLHIAEPGGIGKREEQFVASGWAESIPGVGQWIKSSERNMTTGLNQIRFALFKDFAKKYPNATDQELKAYAAYLNAASGRGSLGNFSMASSDMAAVLFSPRLLTSRFQAPLYAVGMGGSKVARHAAKDLLTTIATGVGVIQLAKMGGAETTLDPEDSDFGKIVVDDTHIDIWGGYGQSARAIARLAKGTQERINAAYEGRDPKNIPDAYDILTKFMEYKIAPGPRAVETLRTGKDAIGKKRTVLDVVETSLVPITFEEVWETAKKEGWVSPKTAGVGAGSLAGVGVNVYKKKG